MTDGNLIEWERKVRFLNGSYTITIPRQIAKKWNIEKGSLLSLCVMQDGSVILGPSETELKVQRRIKEVDQ